MQAINTEIHTQFSTSEWSKVLQNADSLLRNVVGLDSRVEFEIARAAKRHAMAQLVRLMPHTTDMAMMAIEGRAE